MLVKEGIKPWLDIEQIPPGTFWQTELGEQINSIKSTAVFVGNSGIGPWQNEEIQAFLTQLIERKCPVIPTILASAKTTPELPWTLKNRHQVDFRVSDPDPLKQLIWDITRLKPAARENLIPGKDELATSKRTSFEPRHSPPLAHPPDQDQIGQLEIQAICIEPLSSEEVNKYLARGGSKLAALREAANTDSVFQELAQTSLQRQVEERTCGVS